MTTHYTRSNGDQVEIASMNPAHLATALAKLEREDPSRADEIEAMRSQVTKNDAELADKIKGLEAEGYARRYRYDAMGARQYWIERDGVAVTGEHRTEASAWGKAVAEAGR